MIKYFIQARNTSKGLWFNAYNGHFNNEFDAMDQLRLTIKEKPECEYYRVLAVVSGSTVIAVINTLK